MQVELTHLIDVLPGLGWSALPDGRADFLNQRWLDYTGMTAERAAGTGWTEAIHPDDRRPLVEHWQSCVSIGTPVYIEARMRRHDGAYRWFLFHANPLCDEAGKICKWFGTNIDIEDRKRGEQVLLARETSWRQIVDNIPGLVATMRAMGEIEFLNRQTLEYFGKTGEELKNWALIDAVHPDDLPRVIEERKKSIETGQIYEIEHRCRRADGVYRWFQVRGIPVRNAEDATTAWYLLLTDIDDRKRAEEALRARELDLRSFFDNMPGLLARLSPDGIPEIFNPPFLQYLGKTAEEIGQWRMNDIVHSDDLAHTIEVFGNSISTGQPLDFEYRLRRFDGVYRWFQARGVPVRHVEGQILHWNVLVTDIDDRKRAEEALRARERDVRSFFDNMPGFLARLSPNGAPEMFNRPFLQYLGKTLEEIGQWRMNDLIHPDDLAHVIEVFGNGLSTGQPFEFEYRILRFDSVYRWIQSRMLPVRNVEGQILHWNSIATDIDDRKKAEEALRSSERNLSLMISAIPTYIHVFRTDGSVLYANQTVLDYMGITLEDVQREDYRARFFHPEDVERLREERRLAFSRPMPFENEQRVLGKDGKYRWFLIRYNPLLDEQGRIDRWYVAATDIDDRKRAEARVEQAYLRLTEAQQLSKTGSFITDLLVDEHDWSEEAFRIFEFDPAAKVTVQMIRDAIHPEDLPTFEAMLARGMTGADVDFGFRIVTSRGTVKHVRGMARVMAQSAGRPVFIGALQDVTESKLAEEALDKARSELAHVARIATLNALTASIAHEVNQPLSGIITNASTCRRMLDGNPPNIEGARETARRIIRDGNRASDVITRLRALFSKKDFTLEPLDLNEATREVIALSLSDLQRNRVVLLSNLAENLPPVMGDRVQLQQVVLNLLRNASDAMGTIQDRPRELLIRTERDEEDRVRLSVKDAGIGLTPETADKLFEAFYTTKTDGMGIGLSVSRSIIERHHGRLWAEPNASPGATFSFSIPCAPGGPGGAMGAAQ